MTGDADTYTFDMMHEKVAFVRSSLETAISKDKADAATFWTDAKRVLRHGVFAGSAEDEFDREAGLLVARAHRAMLRIEGRRDGVLKDNADIPQGLKDDAVAWRERAGKVHDQSLACEGQRRVEGWSGDSKAEYDKAVTVQQKALRELEGVMLSAAQSCDAGALLNEAIFEAVARAAIGARNRVDDGSGASAWVYYRRTANAVGVLEALVDQMDRAASGEVADGSALVLSDETQNTVTMPNLLALGQWPSGTKAVDVEPAATQDGVTSDGRDAQSDVAAIIRSYLEGVDL